LLGGHFETYEPLISLVFKFFLGCGRPRITETMHTESADMAAHLYGQSGTVQILSSLLSNKIIDWSAYLIKLFFCFILNSSDILHGETVPAVHPTENLPEKHTKHFNIQLSFLQ
jgi:hypothetical protein